MRLTTMAVWMPRYLLAQANTHRMFSRNAASNRAIPTPKIIQGVWRHPVIPSRWPKNGKRMQPEGEVDAATQAEAESTWRRAVNHMVLAADHLHHIGVHKEVTNRLLEPFQWVTWLVTGDNHAYANFFHLRCDHQAQHDMMMVANAMREAYHASTPARKEAGERHLPFFNPQLDFGLGWETACQVCVARCARVSYMTHEGQRDIWKDLELFHRLKTSGHWSPFEHVATALDVPRPSGNFLGWKQYRKEFPNEVTIHEEWPGEDCSIPSPGGCSQPQAE